MAKGLGPVFFTTCGVVMAGLIGYGIIKSQERQQVSLLADTQIEEAQLPETVVPVVPKTPDAPDVKSVDEGVSKADKPKKTIKLSKLLGSKKKTPTTVKKKTEEASLNTADGKDDNQGADNAADISRPDFDVIRVERDGSTVIAGTAKAGDKVILLDKDKQIAETKAGSTGEFVFVLDEPLSAGAHELFLHSLPESGEVVQSKSFAFVDVPKAGEIGDVTVLLAEAGKATKLLQKPIAESVIKDNKQELSGEETASISTTKPEVKTAEQIKPKVGFKSVLIEAAEIEGDKIFIAGTGEPNQMVTLYLDNKLLGSIQIAENGAFLFEGVKGIEPGRYNIRADMTAPGAATVVLKRAEVQLVHEPQVAAKETSKVSAQIQEQTDTKTAQEQQKEQNQELYTPTQPATGAAPEPEITVTNLDAKDQPSNGVAQETQPQKQIETEVEKDSQQNQLETAAIKETSEDEIASAQKPEIRTGSAVIIRRGDSLWTVARRNYGAGIRYTTIFEANRDQIRDPQLIFPGQVLSVPEKAEDAQ